MKSHPLIVSGIAILAVWLGHSLSLNSHAQETHATATPWQAARNVALLPHHVPSIIGVAPEISPAQVPRREQPLGIPDLEAIALANNPTLAQASRRVAALQGKHLQVGLHPNPMIGYQGEETGDDGAAGQQGMFVGQQFITAGKPSVRPLEAEIRHQMNNQPQGDGHGDHDRGIPSPVGHRCRGALGCPTTKISDIGIPCSDQPTHGEPIESVQMAYRESLANHSYGADRQNPVPREHPECGNETTHQ